MVYKVPAYVLCKSREITEIPRCRSELDNVVSVAESLMFVGDDTGAHCAAAAVLFLTAPDARDSIIVLASRVNVVVT